MEPVITIPFSEYKELKDFKKRNFVQITVDYSQYSIGQGRHKMSYNYFADQQLPYALAEELRSYLTRIERLINEQNAAAKRLEELEEKQKHVPNWIVKLFNRKVN